MLKINQGAEAILYRVGNKLKKCRFPKKYRHPALDLFLRRTRARREAKILQKLQQTAIPVPLFYALSEDETTIVMEFLEGTKVRDILLRHPSLELGGEMGKIIGLLHHQDIIHGDLTTSNMILEQKSKKVHLIDFGLSFFSDKEEDKAVDLYLFERALGSTHETIFPTLFEEVLKDYQRHYSGAGRVLERLKAVRKRGRNKT